MHHFLTQLCETFGSLSTTRIPLPHLKPTTIPFVNMKSYWDQFSWRINIFVALRLKVKYSADGKWQLFLSSGIDCDPFRDETIKQEQRKKKRWWQSFFSIDTRYHLFMIANKLFGDFLSSCWSTKLSGHIGTHRNLGIGSWNHNFLFMTFIFSLMMLSVSSDISTL